MALISCPDCEGKVSDAAPACIHCGAPLAARSSSPPAVPASPSSGLGLFGKSVLWLGGGFIVIVIVSSMNSGFQGSSAREADRKQACVRAMASSMGTSTSGYADRAAYEARVREACDGYEINGKDLGRYGR